MAVLEINPAVRESLFVEDRNGKVSFNEPAYGSDRGYDYSRYKLQTGGES